MNEKLAKKLEKLLAKAGLDEDKIDEILSEVAEASAEEEVPDDVNPEVVPEGEGEVQGDDVPPTEELPVEEVPQEEVVPPQAEEVVAQPTDGSIEGALQELAAQEGGEPAPTPDQVPPVPSVDPQVIEQLTSELGEANKTIQGLVARIESLEQALRTAGVITDGTQLGDENAQITPSASHDASADAFDDILRTINGK